MELIRYDGHVFAIDDIYGLDRFDKGDTHVLHVVLRGGETSFKMKFDSGREADRVFDAICDELDVRDLLDAEDEEDDDEDEEAVAAE
jgi:hypothetical protein